ncbi:hypothetical protein HOY80DRAFT_1022630 [Tuber brumale]|nr:hypothetical protein HOY80DRAFT_1022630 [Tuber brumale]
MSHNPHESTPGSYVPTTATTTSSGNESTSPQDPASSPKLSQALPDSSPVDAGPLALACPVLGCPLLFRGEKPHGYLKRHLKRPGVYKRTGDQRVTWIHLHNIEHDHLVAAGISPAEHEPEAGGVGTQKVARLDEFELRARNMGITEKALVTQKMTIWEGMYAAKESGDSIDVSILLFRPFSEVIVGFLLTEGSLYIRRAFFKSLSPSTPTPKELIILREIPILGFDVPILMVVGLAVVLNFIFPILLRVEKMYQGAHTRILKISTAEGGCNTYKTLQNTC